MNHRRRNTQGSSKSVRSRTLRFDVLEERRLFAGMDGSLRVLIFQDPDSSRSPSDGTLPASERVVFVDLNRDGVFQSKEPWAITDNQGYATFKGLAPGDYSVRLIAHRSVLETTSTQPAKSGDWTLNLGVRQSLDWESDTVGWFVGSHSLKKLDVSRGELLDEIELGSAIDSVETIDRTHWLAMVEGADGLRLVEIDRPSGMARDIPINGVRSSAVIEEGVVALASNGRGTGVFNVTKASGTSESLWSNEFNPVIKGANGEQGSVHAIGSSDLVLVESISGNTRISSWQYRSDSWQLVAERIFDGEAHFSSGLADSSQFMVETPNGLFVVSNTLGLPTVELLEQAVGPVVFDSSRGLLLAQSQKERGVVLGWSSLDWNLLFEVPIAPSNGIPIRGPIQISMGYLNDSLIAVVDGHVYRHSLAAAMGASVSISDSALKQVAIGIRTRGENRAPILSELPDFASDEDVPFSIPRQVLTSHSSDDDGDAVYYFVRSNGTKGQLQPSSTDFALFVPAQNANGVDSWSIQAFDGRSWSELQSFRIDIRPSNDPPMAISGANEYRVPELTSNAILGRLDVVDPDGDAAYRFSVSDSRFVFANGVLSLGPGVSLDYEASSTIVLTVTATETNQNDSISKQLTVRIEDRNDPPQGITFQGSAEVPEKTGLAVVGTLRVMDQDLWEVYDIGVSDSRFEVVGNTVRVKSGPGIVYQEPGLVELSFVAVSRTTGDTVRRTERLRLIKDPTPFHNDQNPMDVDGDGVVSPLDPLLIINHINSHGPGAVPMGEGEGGAQIDVDGDGQVTPLDILIIINTLNSQSSSGSGSSNVSRPGTSNRATGEGEAAKAGTGGLSSPTPVPYFNEEDLPGRRARRVAR